MKLYLTLFDWLAQERRLKNQPASGFMSNYLEHYEFVCRPRFKRVKYGDSSDRYVDVDTQYPDLNAALVLPALNSPNTDFLVSLTAYKWATPLLPGLASLAFFGGPSIGLLFLAIALGFSACFVNGYRETLKKAARDLRNATAPLSPQARVVLAKIVECFDQEQPGIPAHIQTVADAVFYLSQLRTELYRRIQDRESTQRVKLAEIQAAAQVAYAS